MKTFRNNPLYMKDGYLSLKKVCDANNIKCERVSDTEFTIDIDKIKEMRPSQRATCLYDTITRQDGF